jgi:hypothetical protein
MSIVGTVRVLPEELPRSAERLRPVFTRLTAEDTEAPPKTPNPPNQ